MKNGWKVRGAGISATVFELAPSVFSEKAELFVIGGKNSPAEYAPADDVEVSDLTVDCNLQAQKNCSNLMAVCLAGNNTRISRVKAINWGTFSKGRECFVLVIQSPHKGPATNAIIEDCIVTQPAPVKFGDGSTAISIFTDPEPGVHDCVVRNNFVYDINSGTGLGQPVYFNAYGGCGTVSRNRARNLLGAGVTGIYRDTWAAHDLIFEDNLIENVSGCIVFNMLSAPVDGLVIKGNVLRPAEGGAGISYYGGEANNLRPGVYATNVVIMNNVIYPVKGVTNGLALSLNGRISVSVLNNVLQGSGPDGGDLFINWPNEPGMQSGHALRINSWLNNVNLSGTPIYERNGGYRPDDKDTIRFVPAKAGWYRIAAGNSHAAATIKIHGETWNNATTDSEFWFRVNSYAPIPNNIGEIVPTRRGSYSYPNSGNVSAVRVVSDWPKSTDVYLEVNIPVAPTNHAELTVTAEGPFRPKLITPQPVSGEPKLFRAVNL